MHNIKYQPYIASERYKSQSYRQLTNGRTMVPRQTQSVSEQWLYSKYENIKLTDAAFSSISYACIKKRSEGLSNLQFKVYKKTNQTTKTEVPYSHPLVQLLNNPNPENDYIEFFRFGNEWLDAWGNTYIYIPKLIEYNNQTFNARIPVQMWLLNSRYITTIVDMYGVKEYKYSYGGGYWTFPADEILHIRTLQPGINIRDMYIGKPIIEAAANDILAGAELSAFMRRYAQNDSLPPLYVTSDNQLDDAPLNEFRAQWNATKPNAKIGGVLSNAKIEPVSTLGISGASLNVNDLDMNQIKKITMIFGVPENILIGEAQSVASAITQLEIFNVQCIQTIAKLWAMKMTSFFANRFNDPSLVVGFDEIKYKDIDEVIKNRESNMKFGITSIEFERELQNIDIPKTDTVLALGTLKPLNLLLNPPAPVSPIPKPSNGDKPLNASNLDDNKETDNIPLNPDKKPQKSIPIIHKITEVNKKIYWDKKSKEMFDSQKIIQTGVKTMFEKLENIALANFDKQKSYEIKKDEQIGLFTKTEFSALVDSDLKPAIGKATKEIIKEAGIVINKPTTELEDDIDDIIESSTSKIKTIERTLVDKLTQIIKDNKDSSKGQISDLLSEEFSNYNGIKGYKAEQIALTTTTKVQTLADTSVWQKYEISYIWLTQRDAKVRPEHAEMDGTEVHNGTFEYVDSDGNVKSVEGPGMTDDPSGDINCRCVTMPVSEEKALNLYLYKLTA